MQIFNNLADNVAVKIKAFASEPFQSSAGNSRGHAKVFFRKWVVRLRIQCWYSIEEVGAKEGSKWKMIKLMHVGTSLLFWKSGHFSLLANHIPVLFFECVFNHLKIVSWKPLNELEQKAPEKSARSAPLHARTHCFIVLNDPDSLKIGLGAGAIAQWVEYLPCTWVQTSAFHMVPKFARSNFWAQTKK